jgi:hypothetical protein
VEVGQFFRLIFILNTVVKGDGKCMELLIVGDLFKKLLFFNTGTNFEEAGAASAISSDNMEFYEFLYTSAWYHNPLVGPIGLSGRLFRTASHANVRSAVDPGQNIQGHPRKYQQERYIFLKSYFTAV